MPGFVSIPVEALRDGRLTLQQFRVLAALHSFRGRGACEVSPSREEISERTGMADRKIGEATAGLAALGWIEKTGSGGRSQATRYLLLNPLRNTENPALLGPGNGSETRTDPGRVSTENPDLMGPGIDEAGTETRTEQGRVLNRNPDRTGPGISENPDRTGPGIEDKTRTDPGRVVSVDSKHRSKPVNSEERRKGSGTEGKKGVQGEERAGRCTAEESPDVQPALFAEPPAAEPAPKAEPKSRRSPARPSFDFETGEFCGLTDTHLQAWARAYPAINVQAELRKAGAWLMSNPANRKSNYLRFLGNWLARSQDRAPASNSERTRSRYDDPRYGYQQAAANRQRTVDILTGRSGDPFSDADIIDIPPDPSGFACEDR